MTVVMDSMCGIAKFNELKQSREKKKKKKKTTSKYVLSGFL